MQIGLLPVSFHVSMRDSVAFLVGYFTSNRLSQFLFIWECPFLCQFGRIVLLKIEFLVDGIFSFSTLMSSHCLLLSVISKKKSAVNLRVDPLCVTSLLSLLLRLSLFFSILITVCLNVVLS